MPPGTLSCRAVFPVKQCLPQSSQGWGKRPVFKMPLSFTSHEDGEISAWRGMNSDSQTSGMTVCNNGPKVQHFEKAFF